VASPVEAQWPCFKLRHAGGDALIGDPLAR
jgi:hypothetical protein